MVCDGMRMWPPRWQQTYGQGNRSTAGEVGRLDAVFLSRITPPDRVYLAITTDDGRGYLGSVIFEKVASAKAVFDFLHKQIGQPLAVLGSMDLPDDFGG
jgi:hypothetical protein